MTRHTELKSVYVALEDFIERAPRQTPPALSVPTTSPTDSRLRIFTALPDSQLLVLGPRRVPPVACPVGNTNTTLSICTSVGYCQLPLDDYGEAIVTLRPDLAIGLADVPSGSTAEGGKRNLKRVEKMCYRTEAWTKELVQVLSDNAAATGAEACSFFAPVLPVDKELQSSYFNTLADQPSGALSGLAFYDPSSIPDIPEPLTKLPRLSLHDPATPHHVLREIQLGTDISTVTFAGAATDAGIALDFAFPATKSSTPSETSAPTRSLGLDMWTPSHSRDLSPLSEGCTCYACRKHHRAYIQHLLNAKEMLAWVLLQIHNLRVLDNFFASIRASIARDTFDADVQAFAETYDPLMPEKTGQGPRTRGYQRRSEGSNPPKQNPPAYRMLDGKKEQNVEQGLKPDHNADAKDLKEKGFGEAVGF